MDVDATWGDPVMMVDRNGSAPRPDHAHVQHDQAHIAVLVVNHRSHQLCTELIRSLAEKTSGLRLAIAIVDNSGDSEEYENLQRGIKPFAGAFTHLQVEEVRNRGFASGTSSAWDLISHHSPEVVLAANPDCSLEAGDLRMIYEQVVTSTPSLWTARTKEQGEITSGASKLTRSSGRSVALRECRDSLTNRFVYPGGHFLALPAKVWLQSGGFSDAFFLYCEEIDLRLRINPTLPVRTLDGVVVHHLGSSSIGGSARKKSSLTLYHATKSRVILYRRHKSLTPWIALMIANRIGWSMLPKAGAWQRFSLTTKAVVDGLRWEPQRDG